MPSELFERLFVPAELLEGFSDGAWLQAMLDFERALAAAEARAGVIPEGAARAIGDACRAERFDAAAIADASRSPGNPVEPLVRALRDAVGGDAAEHVHRGATTQDVLDTATMLVSRTALGLILDSLDAVCGDCARLAEAHRATPMIGRTLLQQALPTTFGLKAAGWLLGLLEARDLLVHVRDERLAAQLGGPAGTQDPELARLLAEELGLAEAVAPWHTNRVRIAELGSALATAAGAAAKVGLDIGLLSQNEVGEVSEAERGVSSAMPHKGNPIASVLAVACARQAQAQAAPLFGSLTQEHERAFGAWHAEWPALIAALGYTGGAVDAARRAVSGLQVHEDRMRANLDASALGSDVGSAEALVDRALAAYRS